MPIYAIDQTLLRGKISMEKPENAQVAAREIRNKVALHEPLNASVDRPGSSQGYIDISQSLFQSRYIYIYMYISMEWMFYHIFFFISFLFFFFSSGSIDLGPKRRDSSVSEAMRFMLKRPVITVKNRHNLVFGDRRKQTHIDSDNRNGNHDDDIRNHDVNQSTKYGANQSINHDANKSANYRSNFRDANQSKSNFRDANQSDDHHHFPGKSREKTDVKFSREKAREMWEKAVREDGYFGGKTRTDIEREKRENEANEEELSFEEKMNRLHDKLNHS